MDQRQSKDLEKLKQDGNIGAGGKNSSKTVSWSSLAKSRGKAKTLEKTNTRKPRSPQRAEKSLTTDSSEGKEAVLISRRTRSKEDKLAIEVDKMAMIVGFHDVMATDIDKLPDISEKDLNELHERVSKASNTKLASQERFDLVEDSDLQDDDVFGDDAKAKARKSVQKSVSQSKTATTLTTVSPVVVIQAVQQKKRILHYFCCCCCCCSRKSKESPGLRLPSGTDSTIQEANSLPSNTTHTPSTITTRTTTVSSNRPQKTLGEHSMTFTERKNMSDRDLEQKGKLTNAKRGSTSKRDAGSSLPTTKTTNSF